MSQKQYFTTRELITVAVLSALGGVLSTYIGYLGNLINRVFVVPFGAGQLLAGLHVFWMILAYAITGKPGTGTLAGILKGMVEFLSGSTHGIPIILVSSIEGILVDLSINVFRKPSTLAFCFAGAVASMSNVLVFQILYFSGVPVAYLMLIASVAALSGVIFAGYLGMGTHQVLITSHIVKTRSNSLPSLKLNLQKIFASSCIILLTGGAAVYYTTINRPFADPLTCQVTGEVQYTFTYRPPDFSEAQVTINAELKGEYTYIPPRDYAGTPIPAILAAATPKESAHSVTVIASDGYQATFDLTQVIDDDEMILVAEDGHLRLIAANYGGPYWVKQVCEIRVES